MIIKLFSIFISICFVNTYFVKKLIFKLLICIIICIGIQQKLSSQFRVNPFVEGGKNVVSEEFLIKASVLGDYSFGNTGVFGGAAFDIKTSGNNLLSGLLLGVSGDFNIREFPFQAGLFLMYNMSSDLIHTSHPGVFINIERQHFSFKLGTEYRSYHITRKALNDYNLENNKHLHENFNLIYRISYNLKPADNEWNIGMSVTNYDYFLINQETNPMLCIFGKYEITKSLEIFAECWYKQAGMFNISVNYFGYLIRTGLIWSPEL